MVFMLPVMVYLSLDPIFENFPGAYSEITGPALATREKRNIPCIVYYYFNLLVHIKQFNIRPSRAK